MQKITICLPEIKLVGISCQTNNMLEMNSGTAKIGAIVQYYFQKKLAKQIANRKKPGTTYCVYTQYESDFNGNYTYFIGEEVNNDDVSLNDEFKSLLIPQQTYIKFTNGPDKMPNVCIESWQKIWSMSADDLGGERQYQADFEIHDERASDPKKTILDFYIGIKN